jgi:prepilin-type N-terminal cleavage/methylation domain-containing protein
MVQLKVLMVTRNQAGFSLIELMFVFAISGLLVLTVFAGQRGLRTRTQFDAAVNNIISSATTARNQALAAVNNVGTGDGTDSCPGGPGQYVYAGVEWVATNTSPAVTLRSWKALPGVRACVYQTVDVTLPDGVRVTSPSAAGGRVLFIKNDDGSARTCMVADQSTPVDGYFAGGVCAASSMQFQIVDNEGHGSTIQVDESGLARRL